MTAAHEPISLRIIEFRIPRLEEHGDLGSIIRVAAWEDLFSNLDRFSGSIHKCQETRVIRFKSADWVVRVLGFSFGALLTSQALIRPKRD